MEYLLPLFLLRGEDVVLLSLSAWFAPLTRLHCMPQSSMAYSFSSRSIENFHMLIAFGKRPIHALPGTNILRPEVLNQVLGVFDVGETDIFAPETQAALPP